MRSHDPVMFGSPGPLFERPEIETPARRGHRPIADTSREAFDQLDTKPQHDLILRYLGEHGSATHDAICAAGLLTPQTSGRMGELVDMGLIEECGVALTRTGRRAKVYRLVTREGAHRA